MDVLLTPKEVAERLKLSPKTIVVWLQSGKLSGIKVGNRWRVRTHDLELLVEAQPQSALLDRESRAWLESDLSRMGHEEAYDWGGEDPLKGERISWDPGKNCFMVETLHAKTARPR